MYRYSSFKSRFYYSVRLSTVWNHTHQFCFSVVKSCEWTDHPELNCTIKKGWTHCSPLIGPQKSDTAGTVRPCFKLSSNIACLLDVINMSTGNSRKTKMFSMVFFVRCYGFLILFVREIAWCHANHVAGVSGQPPHQVMVPSPVATHL